MQVIHYDVAVPWRRLGLPAVTCTVRSLGSGACAGGAGGRWFVLMIQKEKPDSISSQAFFLSVGPVAPVVAYLLYVRRNSGSQNFWNLDTS